MSGNDTTLNEVIRTVEDFPKPGVAYKDITPLLKSNTHFKQAIACFAKRYSEVTVDAIVATEARGFIFGAPLALALDVAFVPVRKPGKLPGETHRVDYQLEYGTDALEVHQDALSSGDKVVLIDDVLATGGTAQASIDLVHSLEAVVIEFACLLEISALTEAHKIKPVDVFSLIKC